MGRQSTGLLFILPAMIVLAMLIAYPVVYTGYLSATDARGVLTIKNYANVLRPAVTTQAFVNLIYFVGGSIVFQVVARHGGGDPAQSGIHRPQPAALHYPDPVGRARHRRGHHLGVDVPYRVRHHQLYADRLGYHSRRRLAGSPIAIR